MADSFDELFLSVPKKVSSGKVTSGKTTRAVKHDSPHPACNTEAPHIHEKAFVTNSAGGEITEGCVEHYYDRIVAVDLPSIEDNDAGKLAEYVVMGEILLNPRFKGGNTYRRW